MVSDSSNSKRQESKVGEKMSYLVSHCFPFLSTCLPNLKTESRRKLSQATEYKVNGNTFENIEITSRMDLTSGFSS